MNIYQRLNEIRKLVGYVKKDKAVSGQGYMAVTHDAVTALLREHLVTQGVMVAPSLVSATAVQDTAMLTKNGVPIIRYEATYDVAFVNCDDPADRVVLRIEAHALDQGDKAPGKAISYATKYAMLKLFSIETGDDDEQRIPAKSAITPAAGAMDRITDQQRAKVSRTLDAVMDAFEADQPEAALEFIEGAKLDTDERVALWSHLDSKQRAALKKMAEARKVTAAQETA